MTFKSIQLENPTHYDDDDSSCRGKSRTAATSKMEPFVIIVNGWKP